MISDILFYLYTSAWWPVEGLSVDRDFVFFAPHELLQVDFLSISLSVSFKATLAPYEIVNGLCVDLPLLHRLVAWDCLGVHRVEIVIRDEDGVAVRVNGVQSELSQLHQAQFESLNAGVVWSYTSILVLEEAWLDS